MTDELKDHKSAGDEVTIEGYHQFIQDLIEVLNPPTDKRDFAGLKGLVVMWMLAAKNHKKFVERVSQIVDSEAQDDEGVLEALQSLVASVSTDIFEVKRKKLAQFSKSDLLSTLIYKLFSRR